MLKIIYTISKLITIEPWIVIPKIDAKLVEAGYIVGKKDSYIIDFEDNIWGIGSRGKAFTKVDGGKFKVVTSEKGNRLVLTYYVSLVPIIIFTIFFILGGIFIDYQIIFFALIFWLIYLLRIDNVKSLGIEMMNYILIAIAQ